MVLCGTQSSEAKNGYICHLQGVNIMAFCKEYNAQTSKMAGQIIPVEITVYEDRSFTFILKTSPASVLLKKAAGEDGASP